MMKTVLSPKQTGFFARFKDVGKRHKVEIIEQAVAFIRKHLGYDNKTGRCKFKAVIGVSGGIDSAVVLALAVKAVGAENVIAAKMPYCGISSNESIEYADLLLEKFGVVDSYEIDINGSTDAIVAGLTRHGVKLSPGSKGNIMARNRMIILYALANALSGKVLDTCNRTEIAMGYLTKYGDGASDFNPIGKIYKTWVWIIARELGVPEVIIARHPSAELVAWNQKDEDDMGISYAALDLLLHLMDQKTNDLALSNVYLFDSQVVQNIKERRKANVHKSVPVEICDLNLTKK